jgi:hypothetical protein
VPAKAYPFLVALLGLVVIAPALGTGWYADDAYYWALPGWLAARHESLPAIMQHAFALWLFGNARFYPGLVVEKFLVFATFTNVLAYKWLLVVLTLITLELFRRCVAAYAGVPIGNLAALVACALLQERAYHDAILAYNGMPQVVAITTLLSLLAFAGVLAHCRRRTLIAAALLYLLAALTYEAVYGFGVVYVLLARARGRSWADALKVSAPMLAISVACFALVGALHVLMPVAGPYALRLAPQPFARAAFDQISAAFPLVYWWADPNVIFGRGIDAFVSYTPLRPLLLLAFAFVAWLAIRAVPAGSLRPMPLVGVGALTIVVLALPVATLAKYQDELRLGWGYLPVFGEYFGVALLIVALVLAVRRVPGAPIVWALLLGACAALTQATNARVAQVLAPDHDAQRAFVWALRGGLLRGVPDGATIASATPEPWLEPDGAGPEGISSSGLYFAYAGVRVHPIADTGAADVIVRYDATAGRWTCSPGPGRAYCSPR